MYTTDPNTINIVAGSEQKAVLEQIVAPWCSAHKYVCSYTLKGSVDQARMLAAGDNDYDAYWFASSVFLQAGDTANTLQDAKPMFLTPTVYAGWKSEMQKLGFVGKSEVTVADILNAVESGRTKVRITNPTQSNSGATAYFAFLNYFAGNKTGQALTQAQLESPAVDAGITRFIRAVDQTPPSTGTMMEDCVAHPDQCRTMFTYEDLVVQYNQQLVRQGKEPLYAVYPQGLLAISDAPLGFRPHKNGSDASKHQIVTALQDYLLNSPEARQKLLALGRRPAATSFGLTLTNPDLSVFNPAWGIKANIKEQGIQYPATAVIQAALNRYQTHFRRPVNTWYCLDGSGSMGGNGGWDGVKAAAHQVFDQDQAAANYLQAHPEDRTTVAIFNSSVSQGPWTVDGNNAGQLHSRLTEQIQAYVPGGGTNMYSCLQRAADDLRSDGKNRKRLVILMSDGKSEGDGHDEAAQALRNAGVTVISIAFGSDANPDQLQEVANATGGAYVKQNDLVAALRNATGYR